MYCSLYNVVCGESRLGLGLGLFLLFLLFLGLFTVWTRPCIHPGTRTSATTPSQVNHYLILVSCFFCLQNPPLRHPIHSLSSRIAKSPSRSFYLRTCHRARERERRRSTSTLFSPPPTLACGKGVFPVRLTPRSKREKINSVDSSRQRKPTSTHFDLHHHHQHRYRRRRPRNSHCSSLSGNTLQYLTATTRCVTEREPSPQPHIDPFISLEAADRMEAPLSSPSLNGPPQSQHSYFNSKPMSAQTSAPTSAPPQQQPVPQPQPRQATADATSPFLRDFNLVAEAAKRAQMAVLMRDLEGVAI